MRWPFVGLLLLGLVGAIACGDPEEDIDKQEATPSASVAVRTPVATASPAPPTATQPAQATVAPIPADWATFSDPILGFNLRYPPDLVVEDLTGEGDGEPDQRVFLFSPQDRMEGGFTLVIATNPEALSVDEWLTNTFGCDPENPESVNRGTVAGQQAVFCTNLIEGVPWAGAVIQHPDSSMLYLSTVGGGDELFLVSSSLAW